MNNGKMPKVVTRYAPSPTGFQHTGNIRTALYSYLWAKHTGGDFVLRIEDTDRARFVPGAVEHLLASFAWLGIQYDKGPGKEEIVNGVKISYCQSERKNIYHKYANKLIECGRAYVCGRSEAEVEEMRAIAKIEGRPFLYREIRQVLDVPWNEGLPLRFRVDKVEESHWNDFVRGELSAGPEALDDFVLIKSDGLPTYNLAHIVDDFEMGVTHIVRSDEWISSVPKFLALYKALDITPPVFVTVPPILKEGGGSKLSKREGARDVFFYKEEGYLPQALVNYLVFLGWNPKSNKEVFSINELIETFDIAHINKSGAQFNEDRLLFMQKEHLKIISDEELLSYVSPYLVDYQTELIIKLLPIIRERIVCFKDLTTVEEADFRTLIKYSAPELELLRYKDISALVIIKHLENVVRILPALSTMTAQSIKSELMVYADLNGRGEVLSPLRVALSGSAKSLDPFNLIFLLGELESKRRIVNAISLLSALE